jgi:UDP-glucose:(glucosyl)LPS alpha-1,2-glucosyltransferase
MTVLNVTGLKEGAKIAEPEADGTFSKSRGGTEQMMEGLKMRLPSDLLDQFHIICSRVRWTDKNRPNILWLHDTHDDPESQHLKDDKLRKRFKKLVFVSHYQQMTYNLGLGVPYHDGIVLQNAIEPIEDHEKPDTTECVNLIYHTTPHRGLELLIPVFEHLVNIQKNNIHLDVFSSFEIYGWGQRDEQYKAVLDKCKSHPNITYHGYQPNNVIREALKKAHIYAYPNIWPETSGISVIEAMSAGCQIVCPNFAALPETTANFAMMYNWDEDVNRHANLFANVLNTAINIQQDQGVKNKLEFQKQYTDNFYNWNLRANQWYGFLKGLEK